MNIFSIIFIYINIQYTFSLGSRDFFGAAPGLKLPRLPCVPLQCRCFPWPPVYGFDGDAARWPPGFAPQWFTGSQSSQRQLYGCNISWAQPREISATIHQFDPQKIRVCNKNNNFQNDQTIWRFKNSNFQHVRISGLCRSRGLLPNLSSMSCILERSSWKQLMASRVLKKRMIGWYSKISKISIGNAGWFRPFGPKTIGMGMPRITMVSISIGPHLAGAGYEAEAPEFLDPPHKGLKCWIPLSFITDLQALKFVKLSTCHVPLSTHAWGELSSPPLAANRRLPKSLGGMVFGIDLQQFGISHNCSSWRTVPKTLQ